MAYCSGDVVVLSKEVAVVALGDAADLPISCGIEVCLKSFCQLDKTHTFKKEDPDTHPMAKFSEYLFKKKNWYIACSWS